MATNLTLETQGISADWSTATGDFDTVPRGNCSPPQILSAMTHLAQLDTPDYDDSCPPHVLAQSPSGLLSFIGQGGTIFCMETDQEVTPKEAADLATGKAAPAVLPPPPVAPTQSRNEPKQMPKNTNRKLGWRGFIVILIGLGFLIAAGTAVAGVFSMSSRGMKADDIMFIGVLAVIFAMIGLGLIVLAFKTRKTVDGSDGSLVHVATGQALGKSSYDYDFDDDFS